MLIDNHTSYTSTFRMLAGKHKAINHSEEEKHFVRAVLSKHPLISTEDLNELLKSYHQKLHYPAMVLIAYSSEYSKYHNDAKTKSFLGEYIILERSSKSDYDDLEEKLESTEQIGEDILAYLIDYYDEHPEEGILQIEQCMNEKLSNLEIGNLCGTKFYITIQKPHQTALNYNQSKFNNLTID